MNSNHCEYCEGTGSVFSVNRNQIEDCPYECPDTYELERDIARAEAAAEYRQLEFDDRMDARL